MSVDTIVSSCLSDIAAREVKTESVVFNSLSGIAAGEVAIEPDVSGRPFASVIAGKVAIESDVSGRPFASVVTGRSVVLLGWSVCTGCLIVLCIFGDFAFRTCLIEPLIISTVPIDTEHTGFCSVECGGFA